jgi:hypothetical protein
LEIRVQAVMLMGPRKIQVKMVMKRFCSNKYNLRVPKKLLSGKEISVLLKNDVVQEGIQFN